jgi:hypothetical protein
MKRRVLTLTQRIETLVAQHGTLRAAAKATQVDAAYLSRLWSGEKDGPSALTLKRLGLKSKTIYYRDNP